MPFISYCHQKITCKDIDILIMFRSHYSACLYDEYFLKNKNTIISVSLCAPRTFLCFKPCHYLIEADTMSTLQLWKLTHTWIPVMIKLAVWSNESCEIRRNEGHLTLNVGLNAQIVLWVKPLSSLSDTNPLFSRVKRNFHLMHKSSTCREQKLSKWVTRGLA